MCTTQKAVVLCGWGVSVWVAGKLCYLLLARAMPQHLSDELLMIKHHTNLVLSYLLDVAGQWSGAEGYATQVVSWSDGRRLQCHAACCRRHCQQTRQVSNHCGQIGARL